MGVILFHGNNSFGFFLIILFLSFESLLYSYKCKIRYEIRKCKKEYELTLEKLERENQNLQNELVFNAVK